MSFYLKNPGGRMIAVESEEEYQRWAKTDGFMVPLPHEIQAHIELETERIVKLQQKPTELEGDSVYLSTVSQGGKDGYGVASSKLISNLRELGMNVELHNKGQKVGILFHNPYSILRMENQFRILFTMFESDKLPDDWRDYLEAADEIIVPSKWCQSIFEKFGFDNTKVIPLGFDERMYSYHDRLLPGLNNKDFVFVHYNAFNLRKGFMELWEAFNKTFRKDEPVKLLLKTTTKQIPFPITPKEYPNVIIEQGNFEDFEMVQLLQRSHCFVYPARGEGFGLTPLEAMATGLPAIIPNATGMTEYFNADCMYEVKIKEWVPATYTRYKGMDVGKMAQCDIEDLGRQMRWVYEHQEEAKEKGRQAAEYVKQYTWRKTAEKLSEEILRLQDMPTEDRPIRNILTLEEVK